MNEQSDGTQGLRPLTPDDVPVSDRWVCKTCRTVTRPGIQPHERLLGGWVRVHCAHCNGIRVAVPVQEAIDTQQEQP
jgi:RNase P subunit RPR2